MKKRRCLFSAVFAPFLLSLALISCEGLVDDETPAAEWYVSLPSGDGEASSSDWTQADVVRYEVTLTQDSRTVMT